MSFYGELTLRSRRSGWDTLMQLLKVGHLTLFSERGKAQGHPRQDPCFRETIQLIKEFKKTRAGDPKYHTITSKET